MNSDPNNNSVYKLDKVKSEKINEVKKKLKSDSNPIESTSKFSYRLWNIRQSDLDPEDKYLKQKSYSFKLEAKFFRFSGFTSFSDTTLMFSKKKGLEIKTHGRF